MDPFSKQSVTEAKRLCEVLGVEYRREIAKVLHASRIEANCMGVVDGVQIERERWLKRVLPGRN